MNKRKNKSINNKKKLVNEEESQIFKKYFESYLEYAGMLFLVLDKELCVSHINKKGVELLGYPEEEIIGKNWFMNFLPSEIRSETKEYFMKALRGEVPIDSYYENPVVTKSGVKTLKWQNTLLKDANRKIFGILASAEDITERKRMEDALRASEERFRLAINSTKEGLWEWNIQTNQEFFSPRWCEIIGYSFEDPELPHTYNSWASRIHPDDYDRVIGALNNHLEKDTKYDIDYRHRHKSGEYRWQNSKGQAIFDQSGKPIKMVGCISDITERKKAEAEIQRERAFLDQLLETAPESIVITDNIGTVLRVNNEFVHMFGYEVDEAVGQNVDDLIAPPGHQEEAKTITESILQGGQVSLESVRRRKDNTILNVSIVGAPVQIAGKQEAVYAIYRDITERKSIEEEMKRLATVDSLTQIFNKKAGIETLKRDIEASLSTKTPTTLVFIDANGLKLINDTYGHIEGDEYLKLIARNMSDRVGEAGTVFRFGGDELIILLPKSDKKKAVKLLNEIEKTIENLSSELQKPYKMSISCGFAVFDPEHPVSNDTLLATADKEMYKMKNSFYEHKRVRAEETLRQNEEKFKTLIETTDTGFHILDAQGRVVDANKEFIRITGYDTLEEILGRSVSEWTAPHDRERSATEVKKCIEQGYVKNLEIDYVNRIGQITPIEINASVIGSGDSAKIFSLCRDITERKQAEKALRESEERYRTLIQNLGEGIGFVNPEEQFAFANAAAESIFGVSPSDLIGRNLDEFTSPEQVGMIHEQTKRHQAGEKTSYEIEISRPNGEKRNLLITAVPQFESQGKFVGTLGVFRDITERNQAEDVLKNINERLALSTVAGGVGIWSLDVVNNKLTWDDQMFRLYGMTPEKFGGAYETWKAGVHPDDVERGDAEVQMALRGEKEFDTEFRVVWPNGTIHHIKARAQVHRDAAGQPTEMIGTNYDITERKRAEEKLKESELGLKEAQSIGHIGSWEFDLQTNTPYWSDEIYRIFGLTPKEITPSVEAYNKFIHPDDRGFVNNAFAESVKNRTTYNVEHRLLLTDGSIKYANHRGKTIYDNIGNPLRSYGIMQDITERKKMEAEVLREKALLDQLVETANESILLTDNQGTVLRVNREFVRMFGYEVNEAVGQNIDELLAPPRLLGEARALTKSVLQGERASFEAVRRRKNGTLIDVSAIGAPIQFAGRQEAIYAIYRDITKRKKAEEDLKNSNEQLKKMYSFQNISRKLNQFLLRCENEDEIYKTVCDAFMKTDLIKFVWIGLIEEGTFDVKPAAYAGIEKEYINSIKAKWDNSQYGKGPTGIAIKTQKPVIIGDIRTDPAYMPWRKEALKRGYLSIISLPIIHEGTVIGVLDVHSDKKDAFNKEDVEFLRELTGDIAIGIKSIRMEKNLQEKSKQLEEAIENVIFTMAKMSESKDPYTAGHQQKVSQLATAIARKMGLTEDKIESLKFASLIHDVGKFSIPGEILSKPSKLTETEFALIKEHPKICYDIIKSVDFPWEIASIILQHHERLDGSGYPGGLKDKEILLEAKILAVADVVEAMSSFRPYRPALGTDKALEELSMNKGKLYDPEVVDACIKLFKEDGFKFK
jgi:diguanylate cyclase (GGDEF)-like protein/PAS domain S-box-containing protein